MFQQDGAPPQWNLRVRQFLNTTLPDRWIGRSRRGGVEDTRLEAKAKDTKKIRGQGQPFGGQTFSRPRTGMLKVKDTAASRVFQKKKMSSKTFSGNLQFIGVARIFD